jgi:hypothetical protein
LHNVIQNVSQYVEFVNNSIGYGVLGKAQGMKDMNVMIGPAKGFGCGLMLMRLRNESGRNVSRSFRQQWLARIVFFCKYHLQPLMAGDIISM